MNIRMIATVAGLLALSPTAYAQSIQDQLASHYQHYNELLAQARQDATDKAIAKYGTKTTYECRAQAAANPRMEGTIFQYCLAAHDHDHR
jgi:hypothetical protein